MKRVLALVFALATLTGCTGGGDGDGGGGIGFEGGDGAVTIVPEESRVKAPELAGRTLDDEQISTTEFAGQPIVVNVWGSWCAPCRAEAPELVRAQQEMPDVAFLGINTRDNDEAPALAFERSLGVTYPSIFDPEGQLLLQFGQLPPKAIPSTLVIDAEGRVAARVLGAVTASTLIGILDDVRADS